MNYRTTWMLLAVAVALFAFIFFFERHFRGMRPGPTELLPGFNAQAVTRIQIQPAGDRVIRVERTNEVWQMTQPLEYPAQAGRIQRLLSHLENLKADRYLTPADLRNYPNANVEFGFEPPQASLILEQEQAQSRVWIGGRTAPGNELFLQVVGLEGVFVVGADLLELLPRQVDDWREQSLLDFSRLSFDRLVVTNAGKTLELQRNPTNRLWRMVLPMETRADAEKIERCFKDLQDLRVVRFVSDDPAPDLDAFGLQPPELTLAFKQGTNTSAVLQFGKSPTNDSGQLYARRTDQKAIVTVSCDLVEPWRASSDFRDFLDRRLVALPEAPGIIEVRSRGSFSLERQTNGWRVMPDGFPADAELVTEFITNLSQIQVIQIVKDVVTDLVLPTYGLSPPTNRITLRASAQNTPSGPTNRIIAQLEFGVQDQKVYARRAGESFVYEIKPSDLQLLPSAGWQLRDRRLWDFDEKEVGRLTLSEGGRTCRLDHRGYEKWSPAPGSSGIIIDDLRAVAIEETVHRLGELTAAAWVERSDTREAHGFVPEGHRITVELRDARQFTVEFGGTAPSGHTYAVTQLDGQPWVFEFPFPLYQLVRAYLAVPASSPP